MKTFYLKIEGEQQEVEKMITELTISNFGNEKVFIETVKEDIYELLSSELLESFKGYNSLEPLFKKVDHELIEDNIYTSLINNRHTTFSNLIELRKEKVGI